MEIIINKEEFENKKYQQQQHTTVALGGAIIFFNGSLGLMCFIWSQRTAIWLSLSQPEGLE